MESDREDRKSPRFVLPGKIAGTPAGRVGGFSFPGRPFSGIGEWICRKVSMEIWISGQRREPTLVSDISSMTEDELQAEVNTLAKWGIIFGFGWLLGLGSLVAILFGFRASRIVWGSKGRIRGKGKAIFCVILGVVGLLPWIWRGYVALPLPL